MKTLGASTKSARAVKVAFRKESPLQREIHFSNQWILRQVFSLLPRKQLSTGNQMWWAALCAAISACRTLGSQAIKTHAWILVIFDCILQRQVDTKLYKSHNSGDCSIQRVSWYSTQHIQHNRKSTMKWCNIQRTLSSPQKALRNCYILGWSHSPSMAINRTVIDEACE